MSYQVLARKWRPQDFKDMVGQDHISSTLCNAIKNDRVGHAYLFVGTRGTGKTTTARIFAKAINCENPLPDANPCNTCTNCTEITAGSSMDVLEIDGASNNGVEDIRRLRDNVQYTPARCKYKVYIIDEVHMLSTAAWNALLKTLEEPPEHVKFFFATTEVHKVLPTILSRCQRFDLKRISQGTIARRLHEIAVEENAAFDQSALNSIARAANGGMRDALSIMDQMIAFCSDQQVISEHDVSEVFGLTSSHDLAKIISAMLTDNATQLIAEINRLSDMGRNLEQLYSDLLHFCRNLMICAISGQNAADILDLDEYDLDMALSIVNQSSADTIQKLMDGFLNYDGKLRSTLNKRVFMEMTLVRIMKDAHAVSLNDILSRINHLRKTGSLDAIDGDISVEKKEISLPEPQKKNDIISPVVKKQEPTTAPEPTPVIESPQPVDEPSPFTEQTFEPELVAEENFEPQPIDEPSPFAEQFPDPEPVTEESLLPPPAEPEIKEEKIELPPEIELEPSREEMEHPSFKTVQMMSPRKLANEPWKKKTCTPSRHPVETREINDSYELPYSTFLDTEYIETARQADPLNLGLKKIQGDFDENAETPGSSLGLAYVVSNHAVEPTVQVVETVEKTPAAVAENIEEPAIEEPQQIIEEPAVQSVEEVNDIQEEYIPEQYTSQISDQAPADTLEEITNQTESQIPEETPESIASSFWQKLTANDQTNHLRSVIQSLTPVSYQDSRFYIAYETGHNDIPENARQLLEGELRKITDNPAMELMLMGASADAEDDKPVLSSGEDVWDRVQNNPFFAGICREFDGKIIDVRG